MIGDVNEHLNINKDKNEKNKEIMNKLNYEKEKNLKLIYQVEALMN